MKYVHIFWHEFTTTLRDPRNWLAALVVVVGLWALHAN